MNHRQNRSDFADVFSLQTLLTLGDVKLNPITLIQGFETIDLNRGIVHKNILAAVLGDEAETLLVLKPLHGTLRHSTTSTKKFNNLALG